MAFRGDEYFFATNMECLRHSLRIIQKEQLYDLNIKCNNMEGCLTLFRNEKGFFMIKSVRATIWKIVLLSYGVLIDLSLIHI